MGEEGWLSEEVRKRKDYEIKQGQYWVAWTGEKDEKKVFLFITYNDESKTGLSLLLGEKDREQLKKLKEILDIFLEEPVFGYG